MFDLTAAFRRVTLLAAAMGCLAVAACQRPLTESEMRFKTLHDDYAAKYRPLQIEKESAWWNAATTGTAEAFEKQEQADKALVALHSDTETLAKLEAFRAAGDVTEPLLARELEVMYRAFVPAKADRELQNEIIAIQTEVEKIFTNHRSEVDGKALTENEVRDILESGTDSAQAEKAWKGYMAVGAEVADKLHAVAKRRNEMARKLGYRNYFIMQLAFQEVDEKELIDLFDELDALTREPFTKLKGEIDVIRAKQFGISVAELRPWHFGDLFFQEAPPLDDVDLGAVYADKDLLAITKAYYNGMGLEVDGILGRSDLYEKPGKVSHAFAADLDRAGDIRILCNLQPNLRWMDTLVHELGHAVYDEYIDPGLPFILRTASHPITTEGYAMMMGAMAKNEEFLRKVVKLPPDEADRIVAAAKRSQRAEKLIFTRWTQVVVRFEQSMYDNPDQDLGKLWWDLKKKYQLLNPPADVSRPDYAAKIHIISVPVYYHSYMLGDLFGAQVRHTMATKVCGLPPDTTTCFLDSKAAGDYMKREIFAPGNRYSWKALTERATGEPLTAKYFARQYVER